MNTMLFSPLEQFEIFVNFFFVLSGTTLLRNVAFFSNLDFTFFLCFLEILFVRVVFFKSRFFFLNFIFSIFAFIFSVFVNMLGGMVNRSAIRNFPIVITLFFFILFLNLLGLVPFGFCVTSQIIITQFLGIFAVGGLTLKGVELLGLKFLNLFVPRNVPSFMLPFLSIIESVSFISRMLSLSIRLFANMVAGHALLHILMGALLSIFNLPIMSNFVFVFFFIPMILIFAIMLLEMGIAFLQAYVFVVLFIIYMNDSYKSH